MSKKFLVISLAIAAIVGSLLTFYASNLFFSDVSNFGAGIMNTTLFATLPMMILGAMVITAVLFIVRFYQRPNSRKVLCRNYLLIAIALGAFGVLFAIMGGLLQFHSFVKPYPFPGYLIIMIVLHVLVIAASAVVLMKIVNKMPDDAEKYKVTVKHVFHTLGLFLLIALAFNRFGAFLFMPSYVQWSSLYKTFVYYLFLLIPMVILAIKLMRILEVGNRFLMSIITLALALVLFGLTAFLGKNDSSFVSAVSAAAPLERLGSMPMEILIHVVSYVGVLVYYIIIERPKKQ